MCIYVSAKTRAQVMFLLNSSSERSNPLRAIFIWVVFVKHCTFKGPHFQGLPYQPDSFATVQERTKALSPRVLPLLSKESCMLPKCLCHVLPSSHLSGQTQARWAPSLCPFAYRSGDIINHREWSCSKCTVLSKVLPPENTSLVAFTLCLLQQQK